LLQEVPQHSPQEVPGVLPPAKPQAWVLSSFACSSEQEEAMTLIRSDNNNQLFEVSNYDELQEALSQICCEAEKALLSGDDVLISFVQRDKHGVSKQRITLETS
jgi:hypothetical protein